MGNPYFGYGRTKERERKCSLTSAMNRSHRENIDDYPEFHYG